jgi:hypothetical protein
LGRGVPSLPRGEEKRWIPSDPLQQLGDGQGQEGDDAGSERERQRIWKLVGGGEGLGWGKVQDAAAEHQGAAGGGRGGAD